MNHNGRVIQFPLFKVEILISWSFFTRRKQSAKVQVGSGNGGMVLKEYHINFTMFISQQIMQTF